MSERHITHFLKVNSNLTSASRETREFRLPRMKPFPKLERPTAAATARSYSGATVIAGNAADLPEMATDVIDPSLHYGAENVRRLNNPRPRFGWGRWMGRILSGHRAARP